MCLIIDKITHTQCYNPELWKTYPQGIDNQSRDKVPLITLQ